MSKNKNDVNVIDDSLDFLNEATNNDYENWSKAITAASNVGGVYKTTTIETLIELCDSKKIAREFYTLDKNHAKSLPKFNTNGAQDPHHGVKLIDLATDQGGYLKTLDSDTKLKFYDAPSAGIDALLVNAFDGNVQAFFDTMKRERHLPYFLVPYSTLKCELTAKRLEQLLRTVKTDMPINIVFLIQTTIDRKNDYVEQYKNSPSVKQLKLRECINVREIVFNAVLTPETVNRLEKEKIISIYKNGSDPFAKSSIIEYLNEIQNKLLPIINE